MLNPSSPVRPKEIESQAVPFRVDLAQEARSQRCPLGRIDLALEDGVLDALTKISAGVGHSAQPALTRRRGRTDIVAHEHQHRLDLAVLVLFPDHRWIT